MRSLINALPIAHPTASGKALAAAVVVDLRLHNPLAGGLGGKGESKMVLAIRQVLSVQLETRELKPGDLAPAFAVKALDGTEIRLSDLRGKAVLLDFWATWCKPCVAFVPTLKTFYGEASQRKDFVMIGMSLDESEERLRQFVKERQLSWPQVRLGASSRVAASYVPDGTVPRYVLIGPDGKIILPDAKGLQEIKDHLEDPQSAGPTAPHKQ